MNHRFTLEPYSGSKSRHTCPKCEHRFKTFKLYIDTETNQYLAGHVGRCDRKESCGYHYTPREYFKAYPANFKPSNNNNLPMQPQSSHFDTIPNAIFLSSLRRYDSNTFCMFLAQMFGAEAAIALIEKYKIGTAKRWPGATVFWQIDVNDEVRTGKIMLYNAADCRRVKLPYNHIAWVHSLVGSSLKEVGSRQLAVGSTLPHSTANCKPATANFHLKQCFFGEHLLKLDPFKIVAIVESEKTAIIASYYYPNYIWLAAGSLEGLTPGKCRVLEDRTVKLYPDANGYAKWHSKARCLNNLISTATFIVDETLLHQANPKDLERGVDIADKWIDAMLLEWEVLEEGII
jgi:hypothetical protein